MKGILPDADLKQAGLVQDFFKQFEGKDAEFKGLYKKYGSNEEFRTTLFQHIDKIISEQIRSESTEKLENTEIEPEIYDKLLKWLDKGIELYNSKRYDEAIPCFDKVLEIDPKYILALVYKGTVYSDLGRNGEAMPYFDKVLGIDPKNSYAWNSKGAALQMLKSYDEALICFNKAIEFDPSYVFPWYNRM
jgi:tetratricopeptide (TPR) repeat protein